MTILEVFIPTYNRPKEFEKCLISLVNCLSQIAQEDRRLIGIAIHDNSVEHIETYEQIILNYKVRFESLGASYFDYRRTGFNIGGINNITSGMFGSKATYVWCLPDDDLARFDSLGIIMLAIRNHGPCFISGGCSQKSIIYDYDSDECGDDDGHENKILDLIDDRFKISYFLSKNVVQLQEYVYKRDLIKKFLIDKENINLLNEMFPGLLALVCLRGDGPFVRLERSIGIFRDGDPRSEWRHLWCRLALIEWPAVTEKLYQRGWLSLHEFKLSIAIFRPILDGLSRRPDLLLGLNRRYQLNPVSLYKYHQSGFVKSLFMSPISVVRAVISKLSPSRTTNC